MLNERPGEETSGMKYAIASKLFSPCLQRVALFEEPAPIGHLESTLILALYVLLLWRGELSSVVCSFVFSGDSLNARLARLKVKLKQYSLGQST